MKNALSLDFSNESFSPSEWPSNALSQMNANIISYLFDIRNALPDDHFLTPSPLYAAHVRTTGTSRHSTQSGTRLSDATDVFCKWEHADALIMATLMHPCIGGVGIYTDSMLRGQQNDHFMLHIDARIERTRWMAWRETPKHAWNYVSFQHDPKKAYELFAERRG